MPWGFGDGCVGRSINRARRERGDGWSQASGVAEGEARKGARWGAGAGTFLEATKGVQCFGDLGAGGDGGLDTTIKNHGG